MLHLSLADDRDCLDPAMRMVREARLVVARVDRLEVVEEQERVDVVEPSGPDAPAKMHAGPFDHRLRRYDARYLTRILAHGSDLLRNVQRPTLRCAMAHRSRRQMS